VVEKIIVSRDEVLNYPWIDHTWVYIYYPKNSITKNPLFTHLLEIILRRGMREVMGKKFDGLIIEDGYVFIKYDTNEIMEILKNACSWILNQNLMPKDPTSLDGAFFTENKEAFNAFWEETKNMLEKKKYQYFYQCTDGRN
jgi:hypothetical protein